MAQRSRKAKGAGGGDATKAAALPETPSWFRQDWVLGLILLAAVFLVYQPVWYAGFLWDDDTMVTANPCIVGPLGLKEIWTTSAADICPLTLTTFWVEHLLWGLHPLGYHLVNVLQHGACAILLWRVLLTLRVSGAWLGAALWALHPVEVESVAWIIEMKNTESSLFFLLSILFFVRWVGPKNGNERVGGGANYGLTLLFAAAAMACKSSTVILPVVLGFCGWWIERKWSPRTLVRVAPIFLMSLFATAVSIWTQRAHAFTEDIIEVRSWPERLATAGDAVWFYLGKLVWPYPLITIYPRWQIDAVQVVSYLPLLFVVMVFAILWFTPREWSRPICFAFAYFLAALLPVLGLADMNFFLYSFVADHFQYLASMGALALAGAGIVRLADFAGSRTSQLRAGLGAALLLLLSLLSWQRSWVYQNKETLWTDTLAKNDNSSIAHNNLGILLMQQGQRDEAMAHYQRAVEIDPNYGLARNNLGMALVQGGRLDEGIAQYRQALNLYPNYGMVHNNLGIALVQKKQLGGAILEFKKALKINPRNAQANKNLANAFYLNGQMDEAIAQFQKVIQMNPNDDNARNILAQAEEKVRQKSMVTPTP